LRRLAAPERFGNQRIGDDEPGLGHFLDWQHNLGCFAGRGIVAANARGLAIHAEQQTVKSASAVDRRRHFHLEAVAGKALEIRAPHQRPVHAGRGHFEPVGAIDRIGDIEHRRERARDRLAVLDAHRPIRPFGHDLDRAAVEPRNLHPHETIADAAQDRLGNGGHARRDALLGDKARLRLGLTGADRWHHPRLASQLPVRRPSRFDRVHRPDFGNKKERVPEEPTLKNRPDHIRSL